MPIETRHVYVPNDQLGDPGQPGLLIDRAHHGGIWWAWILTVTDGDSPKVVQRWYDRAAIAPVSTRPLSPDPYRWHRGLQADEDSTVRPGARVRSSAPALEGRDARGWVVPRERHVWVQTNASHEPPAAGLLVAWHRDRSVWWGWVATVLAKPGTSPTLVQHWYLRNDLRPVKAQAIDVRP